MNKEMLKEQRKRLLEVSLLAESLNDAPVDSTTAAIRNAVRELSFVSAALLQDVDDRNRAADEPMRKIEVGDVIPADPWAFLAIPSGALLVSVEDNLPWRRRTKFYLESLDTNDRFDCANWNEKDARSPMYYAPFRVIWLPRG